MALDSEDVILTCVVYGSPLASVEWQKDSLPLQDGFSVSLNSSGSFTVTSSLTLFSVTYQDSGSYVCVANNFLARSFSVSSSPAVLTVNRESMCCVCVCEVCIV